MIKIVSGNGFNRSEKIYDENKTVREFLEENEIDYSRGVLNMDGCALREGSLDKTFAELGVKDGAKTFLTSIVKADSAR